MSSRIDPDNVESACQYLYGEYHYYSTCTDYEYYAYYWSSTCMRSCWPAPLSHSTSPEGKVSAGSDSLFPLSLRVQVGVLLWLCGCCGLPTIWRYMRLHAGMFCPSAWMSTACSIRRGVLADFFDIRRACLVMLCDVLLVLARRVPWGKSRIRRTALRMRPRPEVELADPVYVRSPIADASGTPQRRSLAAIQMEYRMVVGGQHVSVNLKQICRARLVSSSRKSPAASRRWRTTFNPRSSTHRGDCLFLVLAKYTQQQHTAKQMRCALQQHAGKLLVSGDSIYKGLSLAHLLSANKIDATWFMTKLVGKEPRWGNTLDVLVASHMFGLDFQILDVDTKAYIMESYNGNPVHVIGYRPHHFVAGRVYAPSKRVPKASWLSVFSAVLRFCIVTIATVGVLHAACAAVVEPDLCTMVQGAGPWRAGTGRATDPLHRPFSEHGLGLDGIRHTVQNTHELAIMLANHRRRQLDNESSDEEITPCRIIHSDDTRSLISLLLRRVRRHLHAIHDQGGLAQPASSPLMPGSDTHEEVSPLCHDQADGPDASPSVHVVQNPNKLERMLAAHRAQGGTERSSYDITPCRRIQHDDNRELVVVMLHRVRRCLREVFDQQPAQSALGACATAPASGISTPEQSCLDSNRTLRMLDSRSTCSDWDIEDFVFDYIPASEYSPSSFATSRDALWSPGTTSPGSNYIAQDLDPLSGNSTDDAESMHCFSLDGESCSTKSTIDEQDFVIFTSSPGHSWQNALQLIPLAHEHFAEALLEQRQTTIRTPI
eukprot:3970100-Amphidinium_carterae.1